MNDEPLRPTGRELVHRSAFIVHRYFLKSASNALRASSGVWILPGLSAARSLTTLAWKNVHSLRACLLATRAGMFSRHSQVAVVSKKRQLPQVWRSEPHFTHVSSNVGASSATRCCPQRLHLNTSGPKPP